MVKAFLYVITVLPNRDHCKIGYAANPWHRLKHLQIGNHCELELAYVCQPRMDVEKAERRLHHLLQHRSVRGEWFRLAAESIATLLKDYGEVTANPTRQVFLPAEEMTRVMALHPRFQAISHN